jgi:hypothetical protein
MLPSEVADQLRAPLLVLSQASEEKRLEVLKALGQWGWELRVLRELAGLSRSSN